MEWTLCTSQDYVTTRWSGGSTTQLAIAPEGAVYADRDFLWRLSSAGVELEHSDFTPLPDYQRLIATLKGGLELKVGDGARFALAPYQVYSFDGGVPVESWGRCTDFNLMLRKGACQGVLQALELAPGGTLAWTAPVPSAQEFSGRTLVLYCGEGRVELPQEGQAAEAGQLLLCRAAEDRPVKLESAAGARLMAAVIYARVPGEEG